MSRKVAILEECDAINSIATFECEYKVNEFWPRSANQSCNVNAHI